MKVEVTVLSLDDWEKEWERGARKAEILKAETLKLESGRQKGETTDHDAKLAAGGFPVAVGCHRAIELTLQLCGRLRQVSGGRVASIQRAVRVVVICLSNTLQPFSWKHAWHIISMKTRQNTRPWPHMSSKSNAKQNSTPLWSHHSILRSDETCHVRRSLLRDLAAGMERQAGRSAAVAQFGRVGCLGQASLSAYGVKPVG
jgi:hypothetical protein